MSFMEAIGFIAGTLTTVGIVPEIIKVIKTRDTRGISLTWLFIMLFGSALWVAYGSSIGSAPVIIFNVIGVALYALFIAVKLAGSTRASP